MHKKTRISQSFYGKSLNRKLISLAISASLVSAVAIASPPASAADAAAEDPGTNRQYIGLGVGSAAGAVVAGPAGLVVGGLIGSLVGWNQQQQQNDAAEAAQPGIDVPPSAAEQPQAQTQAAQIEPQPVEPSRQLASAEAGLPASALPDTTRKLQEHSAKLAGILTGGMGIDVFFKSGSVSVEPYFAARLDAIAELAEAMPVLRIRLDGYSDRRGAAEENLELSRARLEAVREKLIEAGIASERIDLHALGEKRFISAPGDLEAYTFDRRVVVRFEPDTAQGEPPLAAADPVRTL